MSAPSSRSTQLTRSLHSTAHSTARTTRATGIALAAVGLVLVANGAWYAPLMFSISPDTKLSQYGGELPFQLFQTIHLCALVALAVVVSRLGHLRGRTGRSLPPWVPVVLMAVTILQAATVYAQAFVVPHLAAVAPHVLDIESIDLFAISMMVIWSAFSLAVVAIAVIGAIRRVIPVVAAIVIALGALSMPMLGPAGALLIGAGLAYWALTRILRRTAPDETEAEPTTAPARVAAQA
ncbi:hypothetical protein [Granulicoccus sp. GXG6511]|uniref:hypothetical protein n=1 Tax=Granulicoccus sp. GXG6511 TaxID=3381351 RepID=UPI003D7EC50A